MRTTLTLDDDVAAKLRKDAAESGRPFREVVNEYLRFALMVRREPRRRKPFSIQARNLGLRAGFSYENVEELLDQAEGPWRR